MNEIGRTAVEAPTGATEWLALLRPEQWVKNLLVFAALIFSKHLFVADSAARAVLAFVSFCLVASASYLMNDVHDAESDRLHPGKRQRPIAAGRVTPQAALLVAAVLTAGGFGIAVALGQSFAWTLAAYAVLQISYSFLLKNIVIVDAMAIATGFVLRAVAGGVVIDVNVSPWLIICTFLLALFLGFSKRRHEVQLLEENAVAHRPSLRDYSPYFLDQMISVVTASTVVAYAIYSVSPEVREKLHTDSLYLTVPFVLYGIFRYLYLVHQREGGGNPTRELLTDRPLWVNVLCWIGTAIWLLYAR
ncbi:MAG: decaprenyl-phosphate phosphoribosyltransferase [Candidatus Binatia bacterium]|jgi:4-hydroxybenzoate polyprenyltransferase